MKIVEYDFKSDSHRFNVWLTESGRIEYTIDGGEVFHAKKLENGKLIFIKPQEVIKKNELFTIHYVEVPEAIYAELAQAQANILVGKEEKTLHMVLTQIKSRQARLIHGRRNSIRQRTTRRIRKPSIVSMTSRLETISTGSWNERLRAWES